MSRRRSERATITSDTGTDQTPLSIDDARLDADAEAWIEQRWQELRAAGCPVSRRTIRSRLLAEWARELDPEPATAALTYMTRHGSRPVDAAVGERVAARLSA